MIFSSYVWYNLIGVIVLTRLKVKNDFIFQRIFGRPENKEILISFLNAILELEDTKKLKDIEILESVRLEKDRIDDKLGILDILARTSTGEQINIEIQLVNQYNMDKRTLFYWSKLYSRQLSESHPFGELKKTITVNILDFNYIELEKYHSIFHLWEDSEKSYRLTDVMEIHFIELPKFKKVQPDYQKPLDRWLLFIEDSPKEVLEMAMKKEPAIEKAEKVLEYLGTNEEIVRYYELREKQVHDEITRITGAKAEGKMEKALEVARKMLSSGMDLNDISNFTEIPVDDLKKHLNLQ